MTTVTTNINRPILNDVQANTWFSLPDDAATLFVRTNYSPEDAQWYVVRLSDGQLIAMDANTAVDSISQVIINATP